MIKRRTQAPTLTEDDFVNGVTPINLMKRQT